MLSNSTRTEAQRLQGIFADAIRRCGQPIVVTPSAARLAKGAMRRTLYATIENPNANDVGHLRVEGALNVEGPMPLIFTFAGTSGVRENDRLEHGGFSYTLLNALPQTFHGVALGIRCVGVRTGASVE